MADVRRPADFPEQQFEQALADLGRGIEFPRTPDLARAVRARIEADSVGESQPEKVRFLSPWKAIAVAAAVLLLFFAAALAGLPDFRHAVADRLGVHGIKIVFENETPTPETTPVGSTLLLGERMTLEEAQAAVPFTLKVPNLPNVGEPDEIYVRTLVNEQDPSDISSKMVSYIYYPSDALPETRETGAGALLMQFESREEAAMLGKAIGEGGNMIRVDIGGALAGKGWFISGPSSLILYPDPSRSDCCGPPSRRPSGNVLLWEANGITYRLESNLDSVDSVDFAESLKPLP
jgi:hypothetical protein